MNRNIPVHYSYNFKLNIDKLPTKESDRINLKILLPGLFLGFILVLLGIFELTNGLNTQNKLVEKLVQLENKEIYDSFISPMCFDFIIIALGLGIMTSLILSNLRYKKIFFDGKNITMIKRSSWGKKITYRNKITDFQGVMLRIEFVQCGFMNKNRYIVELHHKSSAQTVPLYISTSEKDIRKIWVDYAQKLNLPTLLYTDEGILQRNVPDLNKSLIEMADIWNLKGKFNPQAKHSSRIAIKETPDKIIIKLRKVLWDGYNILGAISILILALIMFIVSLNLQAFSREFLTIFYLVCALGIISAIFVMFRKEKLVLKKDKIVNTHKYFLFSTKHDEIFKQDIKGIYVTLNPATERYFVTITSSEKNIIFGKKLPIADLKWIKSFLIEQIIQSDKKI